MTRVCLSSLLLLVLSACKVAVSVPEGGRVITTSGSMECQQHQTCELDIADTHFHETFRAVPHEVWEFTGWTNDFLCGGKTDDCTISTVGWNYENPNIRDALSDQSFVYQLQPQFEQKPSDPLYPQVAGLYLQEIEGFLLNCAYPIGSVWGDPQYDYVTIAQNGNELTLTRDVEPDPSIISSKEWDGKLTIDQTGSFYENIREEYVFITVEGKIKATETSQFSGRVTPQGYEATRITQANLIPRFGPYKGKSIRCTTGPVTIEAERI